MGSTRSDTNTQAVLPGVPPVAVAAHELKAPLSLIRQLSLMIREELDNDSSGTVVGAQELLERVTLTSERTLRLVEMVTKHTRLQEGLFELEPVHVGRICEEVAHELMPLCMALGKRIEVRQPRRTLLAVANRDLLRSVMFSLCDNALAYTDDTQPIIISSHQFQTTVHIAVRDHGPRLAPDAFRRLQMRLGRAPQPISRRPSSSGLGLYVAGQFAEAMQGRLGVTRHRDEGTTFYIETPLSAQLSLLPS